MVTEDTLVRQSLWENGSVGKIMQWDKNLKILFSVFLNYFLTQHNASHLVHIRVLIETKLEWNERALLRILNTLIA